MTLADEHGTLHAGPNKNSRKYYVRKRGEPIEKALPKRTKKAQMLIPLNFIDADWLKAHPECLKPSCIQDWDADVGFVDSGDSDSGDGDHGHGDGNDDDLYASG